MERPPEQQLSSPQITTQFGAMQSHCALALQVMEQSPPSQVQAEPAQVNVQPPPSQVQVCAGPHDIVQPPPSHEHRRRHKHSRHPCRTALHRSRRR